MQFGYTPHSLANLHLPKLKLRSPNSRTLAEPSHDFLEASVTCGVLRWQASRGSQKEQRLQLAQKIYTLYQQSYMLDKPYSEQFAQEVHSLMENRGYDDSGMLQQFIKWYVTFLDMQHGPPEVPKQGTQ